MRVAVASVALIVAVLNIGCTNLPPGYPFRIRSQFGVDDPQFSRTMGHFLGPHIVSGNEVQTLRNGDEIFPAMLQAIHDARKTICFETFIYWKGEIAQRFTDALCERAKAGVRTHVLIDAVGGDKMDPRYIQSLRECGCQVQLYAPLRWFDLTSAVKLNSRTHRKLLIVDGRIGFTGGVGIADEWSGHAQDPDHWRDNHYRIAGPVVNDLQSAFMDHWAEADGGILQGDDYFPKVEEAGSKWAQVFKSGPTGGSDSMQLMYLLSFAAARKEILLATAYFVPDDLTIRSLLEARRRGVRIRILIPNELTDVPITRDASRSSWGDLLKEDVEIYEYQRTMYHTKVMVVDDRWSSVGSANLDNRAFRLNGEANLNVLDPDFAAEQKKYIEEDLAQAHRVTYDEWKRRPLADKIREGFMSILKWQL